MLDRALLARYLRQRAELGERELFLEGLGAGEALALLSARPLKSDSGTAGQRDGGRGVRNSAAAFATIREVLQEPAPAVPISASPAAPAITAAPAIAAQPSPPSRPRAVLPSAEATERGRGSGALLVLANEAAHCTDCRLHAERRTVVRQEGARDEKVAAVLEKLARVRASRVRPELDTKVLTSWNALAARGLIEAGRAFDDPAMTALGVETLREVESAATRGDEVVHEDQCFSRIVDGATGEVLASHAFTSQISILVMMPTTITFLPLYSSAYGRWMLSGFHRVSSP